MCCKSSLFRDTILVEILKKHPLLLNLELEVYYQYGIFKIQQYFYGLYFTALTNAEFYYGFYCSLILYRLVNHFVVAHSLILPYGIS